MEPIDGIAILGMFLLAAGVYSVFGIGAAAIVVGVFLVALWALVHAFGVDEADA